MRPHTGHATNANSSSANPSVPTAFLLTYDIRDDERDTAVEEDEEGDAEESYTKQIRRGLQASGCEFRE